MFIAYWEQMDHSLLFLLWYVLVPEHTIIGIGVTCWIDNRYKKMGRATFAAPPVRIMIKFPSLPISRAVYELCSIQD